MPSPFLALVLVLSQTDAGIFAEPSAPPLVAAPQRATGTEPSTQRPFDPEFNGADVWLARCSMCHGLTGGGNARLGRNLGARDVTSAVWQDARTDEQIREAITDGLIDTKMKAFRTLGNDRQFDELVTLIRSWRK